MYRVSYNKNDNPNYKDLEKLEEAKVYAAALEDVGEPIDSIGIFKIIKAEDVLEYFGCDIELVALHDDGTESVIHDDIQLADYLRRGFFFGAAVENLIAGRFPNWDNWAQALSGNQTSEIFSVSKKFSFSCE